MWQQDGVHLQHLVPEGEVGTSLVRLHEVLFSVSVSNLPWMMLENCSLDIPFAHVIQADLFKSVVSSRNCYPCLRRKALNMQ